MRYILKYVLSLVFFITLFNSSVFAQGGYISLYQAGLNITLQDGKIPYKNDNKTTDVTGFVTFTKNIPDSLECNVSAIFVHRSTTGTETTISDSIRVSDTEFRTSISVPKNFTFKLQPNKKAGQVILRFKYYKKNYPNTTNGWSSMESGKTWQTVEIDTIPPASFNGPSQICGEGIYTITNPGTITLENASGIATLTSLGNNQWKVTRIGNAVGTVYLRSTSSGKIYNKSIQINSDMKGTITGSSSIKQGLSGTITFTPDPGTNYTNLSWVVDAGAHTSLQIDPYNLKITIPANYPLYDTYNGDDVYVTVKGYGECGLMEKTHILRILPRQPSPHPQQ
ncbi:MAG: hypothetical protein LBJ04_22550 [Sphingobacterium sp.]|jgi:hypothetical protein|nr:hypothetical protein [Sphingobacterium sp.]